MLPLVRYALHASVVIVNPGGTGRPRRVISARFAPLPPSRSFMLVLPSEKSHTHLRAFVRVVAVFRADFRVVFAGLLRRMVFAGTSITLPGGLARHLVTNARGFVWTLGNV